MYSSLFRAALLVAVKDTLGRKGQTAHAPVRTVLVVRVDVVDEIVPRCKGGGTGLERALEVSDVDTPLAARLLDLLRGDLGLEGRSRRRL